MISPMARVEVVCMKSLTAELVAFVQSRGVMHIESVPAVVEDEPGFLTLLQPADSDVREQNRLERLQHDLAELAVMLTVVPRPGAVAGAAAALRGTLLENWDKVVREWNRTLRPLSRSCANLADNITVIRQYMSVLASLAPQLDKKVFRLGRGARFIVLPSGRHSKAQHLQADLQEKLGPEVRFLSEKMGRHATAGLVVYPERLEAEVTAALADAGIVVVDAPEASLRGLSIDEAIKRLREMVRDQQNHLEQARHDLRRLSHKDAPRLLALKSMVADSLATYHVAAEQMAESQMVSIMHGWVPEEEYEDFVLAVDTRFGARATVHRLPTEEIAPEQIPTKLSNNRFLKTFETLLQLYPPPAYGTIDATAWVGISFVFFYGFIMADVVYGLIIVLITWQVWKRWNYIPLVRSLSLVGVYMGVSTAFFGVLFGEYMGNLGYYFFRIQPLWIHRISGVMVLLYFSLIIGCVHVGASLLMGIYAARRHGNLGHLYEKTGMFSAFSGMLIAILGIMGLMPFGTAPAAVVGAMFVVLGIALLFKGMGKGAFIQSIEIISLATNVMSYSRLMALGMASTALADVGNQFFESGGNLWVGILLDFLFQVLNICMGLFSPTLHSLRLNYVESLPKFYVPEGHSFKPLRKEFPW